MLTLTTEARSHGAHLAGGAREKAFGPFQKEDLRTSVSPWLVVSVSSVASVLSASR